MTERQRRANTIIQEPSKYKLCEGCESIVDIGVSLCSVCNAYRFDTNTARICAHAKVLGNRERQSVSKSDLL